MCLSETYQDSSTKHGNQRLNFNDYKLIHADNLSNNKRDETCIYFKEFLVVLAVDTQYTVKLLYSRNSL